MVDALDETKSVFVRLIQLNCSNSLASELIGVSSSTIQRWCKETHYTFPIKTKNNDDYVKSWMLKPEQAIHAGVLLYNFDQLGTMEWLDRLISAYQNYRLLNAEQQIDTFNLAYAIIVLCRDRVIEHKTCSNSKCKTVYYGVLEVSQCPLCLINKNIIYDNQVKSLPIKNKRLSQQKLSTDYNHQEKDTKSVFIQLIQLNCSNSLASKLLGDSVSTLSRWRKKTPYTYSASMQIPSSVQADWMSNPTQAIHTGILLYNFDQLDTMQWLDRIISAYQNYCILNAEQQIDTFDLAYAIVALYRDRVIEHKTCSDCKTAYYGVLGINKCPLCLINKSRYCKKCGHQLPNRERKQGRPSVLCDSCQDNNSIYKYVSHC